MAYVFYTEVNFAIKAHKSVKLRVYITKKVVLSITLLTTGETLIFPQCTHHRYGVHQGKLIYR